MEQNQYNNLVRPKKALGQHFLVDLNIARKIVDSMSNDVNVILILFHILIYFIRRINVCLYARNIDTSLHSIS